MIYNCASFFAGVGGIDIGFSSSCFKVVYANEIDEYPVKTYELNSDIKVDTRDIREVVKDVNSIPDFDILLAGFPCQAFSIAGDRKGFYDEKGRGTLFFELIKIIRLKSPRVIFLENVKNLVTHDNGATFSTILNLIKAEGYYIKYKVLNSMQYGNVPQNRERVYIVCFKNESSYNEFTFPDPIPLTTRLEDIIDFDNKVDNKYYYTVENFKSDIVYKVLDTVISKETVYQWRRKYVRENKSGVVPTLTANMGSGGHNVPIIYTDNGVRKITPKECFNAQGFDKSFKLPSMSDSRLYKQAGNSVSVSVISRIAKNIYLALSKEV